MAIWRIQTCKAEAGYRSNASIYNLIREGLWTKPVSIGQRSVGWPDDEVRTLCAARIAGKADGEIRELVKRLHTRRAELLQAALDVLTQAGVEVAETNTGVRIARNGVALRREPRDVHADRQLQDRPGPRARDP